MSIGNLDLLHGLISNTGPLHASSTALHDVQVEKTYTVYIHLLYLNYCIVITRKKIKKISVNKLINKSTFYSHSVVL